MNIPENIREKVQACLEQDQSPDGCETLHTRNKERGGLYRIKTETENSVIVKVFCIRSVKEKLKSYLYLNNGWREWHMHKWIHEAGISVPEPIGYDRISTANGKDYELMAIEDLGDTVRGLPHLKKLIHNADEVEIENFENALIDITLEIVRIGVVDIDHQLNNFLVPPDDRPVRIDFECAKKNAISRMIRSEYSEMIARFIASHVYAVQPDVHRTRRFAEVIWDKLKIKRRTRSTIQNKLNKKLELQLRTVGIKSIVKLPE